MPPLAVCVFDTRCCGHILIGTKVQRQETQTSSKLDQLLNLIMSTSFLFNRVRGINAQNWSYLVLLHVLYHFLIRKSDSLHQTVKATAAH